MNRFVPLCAFALIVTALGFSGPASAQPTAKKGPAMALVVVQQKYADPPGEVIDATTHAVQLAALLRRTGYRVTLIADTALDADTKKVLDSPKGPEPVVVRQAGTAEAIAKEIATWTDEVEKKDAVFSLVVLSGHSDEREKDTFLLSAADAPGKGGVSLNALVRDTNKRGKGLHTVTILDGCRTGAARNDPKEPGEDKSGDFSYLERRDRGLDITAAPPSTDQSPDAVVATTVYSVRYGAKAGAEKGLVPHLVDALRDQKAFDKFVEQTPGQKAKADIRLLDWLRFAIDRVQAQSPEQSHRMTLGSVPPSQSIASRGAGGVLTAPTSRGSTVDLLSVPLKADLGDFRLDHTPRRGVVVTRPTEKVDSPWTGFLVPPEGGLEVAGRALVLDVIADHPDNAQGQVTMSVNPFRRPPDGKYVNLHTGLNGDSPLFAPIPYGAPKRITLGLNGAKGLPLDSIGWASAATNSEQAWPPGATLTVIGMSLTPVPNLPKNPVQPLVLGDLLTDTWYAGGGFRGEGLLQIASPKAGQGGLFQLVPQAGFEGKSRRGGALVPPRYVPRGYALQLDAWADKPAEVIVDLLYIDPGTGVPTAYADRVPVAIPVKGQPTKPIPLAEHGFVNYLRLNTKDAIHVGGLKLVSKK